MKTTLEPTTQTPTERSWDLRCGVVVGRRMGPVWRVARPWARHEIDLVGVPRLGLQLGAHSAVVHLQTPLALVPGQSTGLWVAWPLEHVLLGEGDQPIEVVRPGGRRTVLGAIDDGVVLPAAICAPVDEPQQVEGIGFAALRVELVSAAEEVVVMRRFPVAEGALELANDGKDWVAGTVTVRVHDASRADSHVSGLTLPDGFRAIHREGAEPKRNTGLSLDWLIDATRRSTEFQL